VRGDESSVVGTASAAHLGVGRHKEGNFRLRPRIADVILDRLRVRVRYDREPAQRGALPNEEDWDTRSYLRHVPTVFEAVRNEFGPGFPLLHDGHHRMTPIQAAKLGKSLEPYDLFWLENCTPAENPEALRLVRQHTTTPLAIGGIFNTVWDYQQIIREQLIDYVRSAVTHTGGISHLKKVLDYAAQYQIKSGMHGPTDLSPVGTAAAMHLGMAIHDFGIQEYMKHGEKTDSVFEQPFTWNDGMLHPGNKPGLGVELSVDEVQIPIRDRLPAVQPARRRHRSRLVTGRICE
jgi:mannonate dehydratase